MKTKIKTEAPQGYVVLQRSEGKAEYAACLDGGKWHGWLFKKGAEVDQWVSERKLEQWEVMQAEDQGDDNIVHETVANKAEVEPEPFAYVKFRAAQRITTEGDVDANEWYEFCDQGELGDDKLPAFPVYATPPATTGASTVDFRNDEVFDELLGDYGDSFGKLTGNIDPEPIYQYIEQAYAKVGASTVLTDERKPFAYVKFCAHEQLTSEGDVDSREWYEFCEAHEIGDDKLPAFPVYDQPVREVAAQAGQVAVPEKRTELDGWNAAAKALAERAAGHYRNDDFELQDECLQCASMLHDLKPYAPSPAKESK